jgi:hypothetical protein
MYSQGRASSATAISVFGHFCGALSVGIGLSLMAITYQWAWPALSGALAVLAAYAFFQLRRDSRTQEELTWGRGWQSTEVEDVLKRAYALEIEDHLTGEELSGVR